MSTLKPSFVKILWLLLIVLFSVADIAMAENGEYIGDHCWYFRDIDFDTSGKMQLGINQIGGGHYLCSGVVSVTNPISKQFPAYGNIEIIDGEFVVTLSLMGIRNDVVGINMIKGILNSSDFNGNFESFGVFFDAIELSKGTFTYTSCE